MKLADFYRSIDTWIDVLKIYDISQLHAKPAANSWSLGQVYIHLLQEADFYFNQIDLCISTDAHSTASASVEALVMFANNQFPNMAIEGPLTNIEIPQPESKKQLLNLLLQLKDRAAIASQQIAQNNMGGKTRHPGLGYFNAIEWFQFTDMHFRHHLRQKERIDQFIR